MEVNLKEKGFKIIFWNTRSVLKKIDSVMNLLVGDERPERRDERPERRDEGPEPSERRNEGTRNPMDSSK